MQNTPERHFPRHVAIVMDGNGRWAKHRHLPRVAGHKAGIEIARDIVKLAATAGIEALSLFAFSRENWQRPRLEVNALMELFVQAIKKEVPHLHQNNIRLRFIGDLRALGRHLSDRIQEAVQLTQNNTGMQLLIAMNYSGRWEILSAVRTLCEQAAKGRLQPAEVDEALLEQQLCTADVPEPDLFIRTSGELRLSNFFLWQLAYCELYFTETLWPDFKPEMFQKALSNFANRQRRFGKISEQTQWS